MITPSKYVILPTLQICLILNCIAGYQNPAASHDSDYLINGRLKQGSRAEQAISHGISQVDGKVYQST